MKTNFASLQFPQTAALLSGNYNAVELFQTISEDAVDMVGRNPAIAILQDQKAGNPWTDRQKIEAMSTYIAATKAASEVIFEAVFHALRPAVQECQIVRRYRYGVVNIYAR